MRRLYTATRAALTGALMLVLTVLVAPAAQASEIGEFVLLPKSCGTQILFTEMGNVVLDRPAHGSDYEFIAFDFRDGAGSLTGTHRIPFGLGELRWTPMNFSLWRMPTLNPITATVVSEAGTQYEEQFLAEAQLYCPNLPGSIVVEPVRTRAVDSNDFSGEFAPYVEELSGSTVTFSALTQPASGLLTVNSDGSFTYKWGAAREISFEVKVTNAAGQSEVLPVSLTRPSDTRAKLTSNVTEITVGDTVNLSVLVESTESETTPTGTVVIIGGPGIFAQSSPLHGNGVASFSTAALPLGTHTVTAAYRGDYDHASSSAEPLRITVTEKEDPGAGESECAEGESLNDEGECVTTGSEGEGGEGENPDGEGGEGENPDGEGGEGENPDGEGGNPGGGVKPNPLPDTDKKPVTQGVVKPAKAVPAPIANTGAQSAVWLAGVSVLAVAAGVSLVARRRRV